MMAIIVVGVVIGKWLDNKFNIEGGYFTLVSTLIFVIISLYYVLKGFIHKQ